MNLNRYLEMCEASRELQTHFQPKAGDRVFLSENLFSHPDKNILTALKLPNGHLIYPHGFYYINNVEKIGVISELNLCDPDTFIAYCIYVPYQHQLQERLLKNLGSREEVLLQFNRLAESLSFGDFLIARFEYEELWLMLYYFFVHGKEWDGSKWVLTEAKYASKIYST